MNEYRKYGRFVTRVILRRDPDAASTTGNVSLPSFLSKSDMTHSKVEMSGMGTSSSRATTAKWEAEDDDDDDSMFGPASRRMDLEAQHEKEGGVGAYPSFDRVHPQHSTMTTMTTRPVSQPGLQSADPIVVSLSRRPSTEITISRPESVYIEHDEGGRRQRLDSIP